jgi:hypothetical protein
VHEGPADDIDRTYGAIGTVVADQACWPVFLTGASRSPLSIPALSVSIPPLSGGWVQCLVKEAGHVGFPGLGGDSEALGVPCVRRNPHPHGGG